MKLLFCRACGDIVKLLGTPRACRCGKAFGSYIDDREVTVYGKFAEVIAVDNAAFERALRQIEMNRGPLGLNEPDPLAFESAFFDHDYEKIKRVPWPK